MVQAWTGPKSTNLALSNNNLTVTCNGANSSWESIIGGAFVLAGKFYWEVVFNVLSVTTCTIGVASAAAAVQNDYIGDNPNGIGMSATGGVFYNSTGPLATYAGYSAGTVVGVAMDLENFKVWWRIGAAGNWNNASIGSQDPATNAGGFSLVSAGPSLVGQYVAPAGGVGSVANSDSFTGFFAPRSWAGIPPAGFIPFDLTAGFLQSGV